MCFLNNRPMFFCRVCFFSFWQHLRKTQKEYCGKRFFFFSGIRRQRDGKIFSSGQEMESSPISTSPSQITSNSESDIGKENHPFLSESRRLVGSLPVFSVHVWNIILLGLCDPHPYPTFSGLTWFYYLDNLGWGEGDHMWAYGNSPSIQTLLTGKYGSLQSEKIVPTHEKCYILSSSIDLDWRLI